MESVLSDPGSRRVERRARAGYQDCGTKAIIITVDQQASVYERDLHDRNLGGVGARAAGGRGGAVDPETGHAGARLAARDGRPRRRAGDRRSGGNPIAPTFPATSKYRVSNRRLWYNWGYINEVRKSIKVPMIIKGIVTAEDASRLREAGGRRDHRVEPWRPVDGLRPVHARSAAGNRGGGATAGFR